MQSEEQKMIEGLFTRLKQAESQSGPRDAAAEKLIQQQLIQQPDAPYYMAQAIIIQEAAMKQLNARVSELETRLSQAQQPQQSSGGFLAGLFGGGSRAAAQPQPAAGSAGGWGAPQPQMQQQAAPVAAAPAAGRGFLGGALQTAVGVAGGVVMADMLTSMFRHSQPEEIVNIINEPALPETDYSNNLDTFNGNDNDNDNDNDNSPFLPQDNGMQQDFASQDFDNGDFDNSDFDDDSFV